MTGVFFALFNDDGVGQDILHFRNPSVELRLLVLRFVVFAVLRQVAEGTGLLDLLRHFLLAGGFQIIQLIFQLFQPGTGNLNLFRHK